MADESIGIDYVPLSEVERWPRNPKKHDHAKIKASMERFGFNLPLNRDESTGKLVAGHGRLEVLTKWKSDGGSPPKRIKVREDGEWMVPVLTGIAFDNEEEAEAYLLADNRLVELGGWDEAELAEMLQTQADMADSVSMDATGFTQADLASLLSDTNPDRASGKTPADKVENFLEGAVKQVVFYFEGTEYDEVLARLQAIIEAEQLESHTEAFLLLLERYFDDGAGDEDEEADEAASGN